MSLRSRVRGISVSVAVLAVLLPALPSFAGSQEDAFWEAARQGDVATLQRLHGEGVDVNARTKYGATALSYACDRGHLDAVRWLVDNGADVNTKDEFYQFNPIGWALFNKHWSIVTLLMEKGATGAGQVLSTGVREKNADLVAAALKSSEIDGDMVASAIDQAKQAEGAEEIVKLLESADVEPTERPEIEVGAAVLDTYVGKYSNKDIGMTIDVRVEEGQLVAQPSGQPPLKMRPLSETKFEAVDLPQVKLSFAGRGGIIENAIVEQGSTTMTFPRVTETAEAEGAEEAKPEPEAKPSAPSMPSKPVVRTAGRNWPAFRGVGASGVSDGQGAPVEWDIETGKNVAWKTPIPGIANSSPIIWGDKVFVTTAISGKGDESFRTGLYGDVDSVDDVSEHDFRVYALDKASGKILWERSVAKAAPQVKRHTKATQANSTPVTDGKHVVALFGSVGILVCFDMNGKELWQQDIGVLDAGWFYDKSYQWGHASSPVIYKDLVIVQADVQENSWIAAWKLSNGKLAWKTPREEVPSWGTPTIYEGKNGAEVVTNGTTIRGYDPATGKELWTLGPNSEVTVGTPVAANGLFYVTGGYPPVRPIYAIKPGSRGDLTLAEGAEKSDHIAWSNTRGGTYMPTPLVYDDLLYTCNNDGRMVVYDAASGEQVYRERVGGGGSFTASPIASDGRLYFTNEDGDVVVIRAGRAYEELAKNSMGEICMATPAISDGTLVVRTLRHVYGIAETATN